MLFKCGSCAYINSNLDGKGPCLMCNDELLLGCKNLDSVLDVVEACRFSLNPNLVGSEVKVVGQNWTDSTTNKGGQWRRCRWQPLLVEWTPMTMTTAMMMTTKTLTTMMRTTTTMA